MALLWFHPARRVKIGAAPVVLFASDKHRLFEIRRIDRSLYHAMIIDLATRQVQTSVGLATVDLARFYCECIAVTPDSATVSTRRMREASASGGAKKWRGATPAFLRDELNADGWSAHRDR